MFFWCESFKGSFMLLFFRDDNGDFIAACGYCGRGSLAYQLMAIKGPPAVTPASDEEKPGTLLIHESCSQ